MLSLITEGMPPHVFYRLNERDLATNQIKGKAMRMDKLTSNFQMALADAQSLALGQDHAFIEPIHVLKVLMEQDGGSTQSVLAKANVNVPLLRTEVEDAIKRLPRVEGTGGEMHISNDLGRLLNLCDKLAQKRKDQYISS